MARTVQDVALMMAAIAGPDPRSPIAIAESGDRFLEPLERSWSGTRIAWSPTLGGLPIETEVLRVLEQAIPVFTSLGCEIELSEPNLQDADEVFRTLRAWRYHQRFQGLIQTHRENLKDTIQWNVDEGAKITGPAVARAEQLRTRLFHRMRRFFQHFDFLLAPVVQVLPFDLNQPYVQEINGQKLDTYIDWMKSCYLISATGLPCASVPAGFSSNALPVGLQIIGRHQDDFGVLQLAYAFQEETEYWKRRPAL
jgi:amidase